jgi:hypothetical protein
MDVRLQTLLSMRSPVQPPAPLKAAATPIETRNVAEVLQTRPRGPGQWPVRRFGAGR